MATLWVKAPDEVQLFSSFHEEEKARLEAIFSTEDEASPWNKALTSLGLKRAPVQRMINWHQHTPYFNAEVLAAAASNGGIRIIQTPDRGYSFDLKNFLSLFYLIAAQWKIGRFLASHIDRKYELPAATSEKLIESLSLGLALQSMMMRLDKNAATHVAAWLASPDKVPPLYRKTMTQIQAIQLRRTALSSVWRELFPSRTEKDSASSDMPDYFWDIPEKLNVPDIAAKSETSWKGIGICNGQVSGRMLVVTSVSAAREILIRKKSKAILVFRRARPETTELFEYADAVLYAEGGALSHACTVAREQNKPCITGLGMDFYEKMAKCEETDLTIDCFAGSVHLSQTQRPQ
jgi:phosphohistidine swiveling domain-containing protein